jgi:type VII secretion protein EccB
VQSRRDQVQAQSYVLGRLTSALVRGEPEALENPHRRLVMGTTIGLALALLIACGFTVLGLLSPGSASSWRQSGQLIVEKETGARYVLVGGVLRPVMNYASAVLLFGKRPPVASVSSASLRSTPRGLPVGIVGAPEALPDPAGLRGAVWSVCAMASSDTDGSRHPATVLALTRTPAPDALGSGHALAVRAAGGPTFLVWQGIRYQLTRDWAVNVLGLGTPTDVEPAWLNQLPAGPDLGPLTVAGRGRPGPPLGGAPTRIGQVYLSRMAGRADRYFLVQGDGLSPLNDTALDLALGDPDTAAVYAPDRVEPLSLTAAALAGATISNRPVLPDAVPATPPPMADPPVGNHTWCVQEQGGGAVVRVTTPAIPSIPADQGGIGVTRTQASASAVGVQAGIGGLARLGRPGQATGALLFLITDAGVKFPVPGDDSAKALGYNPAAAAVVTPSLLGLLPTGPTLDLAQAGG